MKQVALTPEQRSRLTKAGYRIVGPNAHSAVKICLWTKKALFDEGHCYKQQFYGIQSHRCLQFTPALPFCDHRCVFCWRDTSITNPSWRGGVDEPNEIIEEAVQAQRKLLNGFPGNPKTNMKKWKEAQEPNQVAISLAGEPTLYPRLPALIKLLSATKKTSFLVTNGQHAEALEALADEKALPTQLYVSLVAHDEENYEKVCRPLRRNGWRRFKDSLELMRYLRGKTRTVLRMTLAKGLNFEAPEEYAGLIEESGCEYAEVKAYMALGSSRLRLGVQAMPSHEEIKEFANALAGEAGYVACDEHPPSRVVLLCRDENAARKRFIKPS